MKRVSCCFGAAFLLVLAFVVLAAPPNHFLFVVLGDRTGDPTESLYEQVYREAIAQHPAFILNIGDSIQGGNDATAAAQWKALHLFWAKFPNVPQYFTPGNHDIFSGSSRTLYEKETGHPAFYSFDYQNAHFTVLDNSDNFGLSQRQLDFLASDLERNRARSPKFVSFHQPFWLLPVKLQSSEFPFHQLAKRYGVSAVFSGHGHQFVRLQQDGIVYLEAGSSGGKLKGSGYDQGWFFGYTTVAVEGSSFQLAIHETAAPYGQSRLFHPR